MIHCLLAQVLWYTSYFSLPSRKYRGYLYCLLIEYRRFKNKQTNKKKNIQTYNCLVISCCQNIRSQSRHIYTINSTGSYDVTRDIHCVLEHYTTCIWDKPLQNMKLYIILKSCPDAMEIKMRALIIEFKNLFNLWLNFYPNICLY